MKSYGARTDGFELILKPSNSELKLSNSMQPYVSIYCCWIRFQHISTEIKRYSESKVSGETSTHWNRCAVPLAVPLASWSLEFGVGFLSELRHRVPGKGESCFHSTLGAHFSGAIPITEDFLDAPSDTFRCGLGFVSRDSAMGNNWNINRFSTWVFQFAIRKGHCRIIFQTFKPLRCTRCTPEKHQVAETTQPSSPWLTGHPTWSEALQRCELRCSNMGYRRLTVGLQLHS